MMADGPGDDEQLWDFKHPADGLDPDFGGDDAL